MAIISSLLMRGGQPGGGVLVETATCIGQLPSLSATGGREEPDFCAARGVRAFSFAGDYIKSGGEARSTCGGASVDSMRIEAAYGFSLLGTPYSRLTPPRTGATDDNSFSVHSYGVTFFLQAVTVPRSVERDGLPAVTLNRSRSRHAQMIGQGSVSALGREERPSCRYAQPLGRHGHLIGREQTATGRHGDPLG